MTQPLVSILVSTYNEESFVKECILSILDQDYKNLEVIVSDDCSTDGTLEVLKSIDDPRLRIEQNEKNLKHELSWNLLLQQVRGKYVKMVCSDDLLDTTCVSKSVAALEARPDCVMSFCGKHIIDSRGQRYYTPRLRPSFEGMSSLDIIKAGLLSGSNHIGEPNNVLFRSDAITRGVRYNFSIYWMVDTDFYLQLAPLGNFAYIPEKLTSFRISFKSWSVLYSYKQASSFRKFILRPRVRNVISFNRTEILISCLNAYKLQTLRQMYYVYVLTKRILDRKSFKVR